MALPQKFTFDVSFDHLGATNPRSRAERRFTRAELEATREAALAEGHAAGVAEAAAAAGSLTAESLQAITQALAALLSHQDATAAETQRRAMTIIRAILAKLVPALGTSNALAEVEAFATQCLHEAIDEPRVVMRVAPSLYDGLRERLDGLAVAAGYAGRIVLLADEAIAPGDAKIEWAEGGAERNLAQQCADIDALLERCGAPANPPTPVSA